MVIRMMESGSSSGQQQASSSSEQSISDVELLEFLVNFSANNNNSAAASATTTTTAAASRSSNSSSKSHEDDEDDDRCGNSSMILERWEPGEIVEHNKWGHGSPKQIEDVYFVPGLDRSPSQASTASNPSTPNPPHTPKRRGPRPKRLTVEEKRQKRLDANDRERERMGKLNSAFNQLRHLLPKHGNDRELSKFETIQIAKNYIKALNQMLDDADEIVVQKARL